eukprot:5469273-Ditylum_brightwellii.AAC.1
MMIEVVTLMKEHPAKYTYPSLHSPLRKNSCLSTYKGSVQQNIGVDHLDIDLDPLHIQALEDF